MIKERVEVETVEVGRVGERALLADLYRPPVPNGCGVLLVHGGSWINGDRTQLRGYGIQLGRLGYTSLACEYRLAPKSKWPAQIDDVNTALRYFHAQAPELGIEPSKIAASGNSAGGHLALIAAGQQESPLAAVIAFYPPTDFLGPGLSALGAPSALSYLLGDNASDAQLAAASPVSFVDAAFPPAMLVTGNEDEIVDWHDSHTMYMALTDAGARAELHVFDGQPHAFDAQPAFGRPCAGLMALFLDRYVRDSEAASP